MHLLLSSGASVEDRDVTGKTPLLVAAYSGQCNAIGECCPHFICTVALYKVLLGKYGQHTHKSSFTCSGFKIRIEGNPKWMMVCSATSYGTEIGWF